VSCVTDMDAGSQKFRACSAVSGSSSCQLKSQSTQQRTLLNLQVQYVECIATGRRHNGQPGSLTLTGQVGGLLVLCK
jgi:hypothetical protein